jgi:seryl-tRNA synthetase
MLDVNLIRQTPDAVSEGIKKKNADPKLVDKFLRLDEDWRGKTAALDQLKADQNVISRELAAGQSEDLVSKAQLLKKRISDVEAARGELEEKRAEVLAKIPNVPFPDVPVGPDESGNKVLREVGEHPAFGFEPKDYFELGESLGVINTKKAAEVAGSRFGYLMGDAVLLEFALIQLAFETLVAQGFIPVLPPVMAKTEVMKKMGKTTFLEGDSFYLPEDDLYLIGSAEHTLGPLLMDETMDETAFPRRYVGFSTCFRRESGSYGKDTKGILRVHQFDKVEMYSFTTPDKSEEEHRFLLSMQETLMKKLELPYRVVEICTGDMGWTDARQFDVETWFPAQKTYRETQSASNTTDFQTRGIKAKYRTADGKNEFLHALNATAFSQRPILAILENFQTKKGTVKIPKVLQKYVGKKEIGVEAKTKKSE